LHDVGLSIERLDEGGSASVKVSVMIRSRHVDRPGGAHQGRFHVEPGMGAVTSLGR